jgi:anti-sigma factor RsiW
MTGGGIAITDADLLAYADSRLDAERRAAVDAWLADHPEECARAEEWERQNTALRTALAPVADEPVPAALTATLGGTSQRRRAVPDLVAAAAVAVAFVAGLGAGYMLWNAPAGPQAPVELATVGLDAHRIYAVEIRHPVEVGADEEQHLVTWLTKRLDTPVKAPNLSGEGLRLLGGRLIPSGDKPAALLMYEGENGERFSLLVAREPATKMTAFRYAESGTIGAFYWIDGGAGYALSGPADRNRLLRIARAVYEQLDN